MSAIKKFQECTQCLDDLSKAAVGARTEVQKLLDVLEGPVADDNRSRSRDRVVGSTVKYVDGIGSVVPDAASGAAYTEAIHHPVGSFSSRGNPATIVVSPTNNGSAPIGDTNNGYTAPIGIKTLIIT
jgi:hypothetical protein